MVVSSLVLLQNFLKVVNLETVSDYVHRCFRIMTGSGKKGTSIKFLFMLVLAIL